MKLVIGIGNPGEKYHNTRHNIGFLAIDKLVDRLGGKLKLETSFQAYVGQFIYEGQKAIIVKPLTYVNLSGDAVIKVANFYKIALEDILVIVDDINLPTGKLRLREEGSDGGHNGLKSIIKSLNSKDFKRIRVGIGKDSDIPLNNYVLGKISQLEHKIIDPIIDECVDASLMFIKDVNFKDVMTKYNSKAND